PPPDGDSDRLPAAGGRPRRPWCLDHLPRRPRLARAARSKGNVRMKTRATCIAVMLLCMMGCGLKGPLYLPDHAGAVVTRPAAGAQNTRPAAPAQQPGAAQEPTATQ